MRVGLLAAVFAVPALAQVYDAIVIGGGISGLSAARQLADDGKTFVVLEARNRTGGRIYNKPVGRGLGETEVGAEFIGKTQDKVIALSKELGLELFDEYNEGKNIFYDGERHEFSSQTFFGSVVPPVDLLDLAGLAWIQYSLDNDASSITPGRPWEHEKAAEWDAMTFDDWLRKQNPSDVNYKVIETSMLEIFSAQMNELSYLYVVSYIASAGNESNKGTFERLTTVPDGGQQWRVVGGTQLLTTGLAKKIGEDKIKLDSPVASVTKSGAKYEVTTKDNTTYEGKHVIVAMSPPMADKIKFTPALSAERQALQKGMPMGHIGKGIPVYKEPFWRKQGLSGQVVSTSGRTRAVFDVSDYDGKFGALLGFVQANDMRALDKVSEDEMKKQLMVDFVNYYGEEAKNTITWVIQRWDLEEYSGGGPTAIAPPNVLSKYGKALTAAEGNIHFAGTEAADYWQGYMEGGIRAGERAAKEVN
ncbi:monoamine oxidase [Malassezia cuniculi]|uniref:Amine oxidase n=1 Tax=Malassezia cuniculi TaxID=948313 RepID=A0AAF0EV40_9BASI|nr:monoamine oxidase [Malassezia cuniculi]